MKARTIVFVHGMFMTALCWEGWLDCFQAHGYKCLAPNWPGRDRPIETLRKNHSDPQLGNLTLSDVVEHFAGTIRKLGEKPILIGHSMGGLVVQILLQRDLAAAGVAIDSAPPAGVFTTKWSFLKANWPMINPFVSQYKPRQMSFEDFQYAFVNTLPPAEQRAAYVEIRRAGVTQGAAGIIGWRRPAGLQEESRAAPADGGFGRPHHSRVPQQSQLYEVPRICLSHRLQGVRGAYAFRHRAGGLAGSRRLRDCLVER
jgi:pimeloyl-ACP methyl ester carboxylesterase